MCSFLYTNRICPREGGCGSVRGYREGGWNKWCCESVAFVFWGLTRGVVSDSVKHLGTGPWNHLARVAPRPAGANAIDGGVAVDARTWSVKKQMSGTCAQTFPARLRTIFSFSETLTMCWSWEPSVCVHRFNDYSCALFHLNRAPSPVSDLFSECFTSLMLVLIIWIHNNPVSLVWYSTAAQLCSDCVGNQLQRVQLTAPLTRSVAHSLVPGGDQGLHCNKDRHPHQQMLSSFAHFWRGTENLISCSLTATKGEH